MINILLVSAFFPVWIMFFFWLYQVWKNDASVIDIGWALGLAFLCCFYAINFEGYIVRKVIICTMVTVWALRLSFLLIRRMIRSKKEDRRYQLLRKDWAPNIHLKFLILFEVEALLDVVLSLTFLIICMNPDISISMIEIMGILVWLGGFLGEIIADEQLHGFIKKPENKGKVCQIGLWNYSRHPNYFCEWCMWVGYFLFALGAPYGWVAISSPLIMLHLLLNVTGVPFAEAMSLKSKGDRFREYQKTTSIFFPLPKKRI